MTSVSNQSSRNLESTAIDNKSDTSLYSNRCVFTISTPTQLNQTIQTDTMATSIFDNAVKTIDGSGVEFNNGTFTIRSAGIYFISATFVFSSDNAGYAGYTPKMGFIILKNNDETIGSHVVKTFTSNTKLYFQTSTTCLFNENDTFCVIFKNDQNGAIAALNSNITYSLFPGNEFICAKLYNL